MRNEGPRRRSLAVHVAMPALLLLIALALCEWLELDLTLARLFWDPETGAWPWREAWLTETVAHRGGRTAVIVTGLIAMAIAIIPWKTDRLRSMRRKALYVFLTMLASAALVGTLKSQSSRPCPWDLQPFGGAFEHTSLYGGAGAARGGCFPAAHASTGFSLLSLYFIGRSRRAAFAGLLTGLMVGTAFGIAQMARGAHFLSHTLWAAGICWFVAFALDGLLLQPSRARSSDSLAGRARLGSAMALLLALLIPSGAMGAEVSKRIVSIRIVTEDVFPDDVARGNFGFRTANRLHVVTRETLIRRLLLFQEGDQLDPGALLQTERNLRALQFLESASVRVIPLDDESVDVEVITRDSWTTEAGISVGSTGGSGHLKFELQEKNLLGSGRELKLLMDEDSERSRMGIEVSDPSFLRPYWQADLGWFDNSDGSEQRLSLRKPFVSIDERWSFDLGGERVDQEQTLYGAGLPVELLRHDRLRVIARAGRRIGNARDSAHRVSAGVAIERDDLQRLDGASEPSETREFEYVTVGYEFIRDGFIKRNHVNRGSRYEDFNLGLHLRADLGVASQSSRLTLAASRGWLIGESFVISNLSYGTRFGETTQNSMLDLDTRWIRQYQSHLPQTSVVRASYRRGWELDRNVQLFADGESGLRGYRLHAFEGDAIFMVNAEHRISWDREIAHLFTPGAALFADSAAVSGGRLQDRALLRTDVGIGLRFAIGRSSRNMLRFDLAFPLDPDPAGRRSPLFSFSSGHAF